MKIINSIIGILFAVGVSVSCSDEKELSPSMADRNYFAVPDGLNDPESVLRKEFFASNKSYLLFNDTLFKEEIGKDPMGNPVYSSVVADPGYTPTMVSATKYRFGYLKTIEQQKAAISFIQTYLLPYMGTGLKPYAFLLVDTVRMYQYKTNVDAIQLIGTTNIASGLQCMAVASTGKWGKMTEAQEIQLKTQIFMELVGTKIKKMNDTQLSEYHNVSGEWYGKTGLVSKLPAETTTFEQLGFIKARQWYPPPIDAYSFLAKVDDVSSFVDALFAEPKEAFYTKYAKYPLVLKKYNILLAIATDMGLRF